MDVAEHVAENHDEKSVEQSLPPYGEPASRQLLAHLPRRGFPYGSPAGEAGRWAMQMKHQLTAILLLAFGCRPQLQDDRLLGEWTQAERPLLPVTSTCVIDLAYCEARFGNGDLTMFQDIQDSSRPLTFLVKSTYRVTDSDSASPRIVWSTDDGLTETGTIHLAGNRLTIEVAKRGCMTVRVNLVRGEATRLRRQESRP